MNIRQKIIASFLVVIVLLIVALGSVFVFHTSSVEDYKRISNTLILENTLTSSVSELTEAYNAVSVAPLSKERETIYNEKREQILETFTKLDMVIVDEDSQVAYQGLKNIILVIIDDLDNGKRAVTSGDIVKASEYYNQGVHKKAYVESNATLLVLKELQHLDEIQNQIEQKYREQLLIVLLWILAVVCVTTLYALLFARNITSPIKQLSVVSNKVSQGDYHLRISEELLRHKDEVGILANSFNTMLEALHAKIKQVEIGNNTIMETKKHLEERNAELERFNDMVIGRELKMVELKKQIAELEYKLKSATKPPPLI